MILQNLLLLEVVLLQILIQVLCRHQLAGDVVSIFRGEVALRRFYRQFHPSVEKTLAAKKEHKAGERLLGTDPASGKPVSVKIGRFGPMVQIGSADDGEKPRFSRLEKGMSIETITLDEALKLFRLPRTLGEYDGAEIKVNNGRYGPYAQWKTIFASLPKGSDPLTVTLDEAVSLIKEKQEAEAQRHIKKFAEEPELEIMNGRYGPYIAYKGSNYKIPEGITPEDLNLQACMDLIKLQSDPDKPKARRGKTARKKA